MKALWAFYIKWKWLSCLCDPIDYTLHGILQARILEWVDFPFSGDLPNSGIEMGSPALQADSLPTELSGKPQSIWFSSVAQSCPTLCDPMNRSTPGLPVYHQLPEFTQTHAHWVSDAFQPSHPLSSLLLLPSIFPSIRVFSNESVLCISWPKYWRFSFKISPSNE